jgi:hypothetical protein
MRGKMFQERDAVLELGTVIRWLMISAVFSMNEE